MNEFINTANAGAAEEKRDGAIKSHRLNGYRLHRIFRCT